MRERNGRAVSPLRTLEEIQMSTEREKKFWEAVDTIKHTIGQELLVRRDAYGKDTAVDTFMIQGMRAGITWYRGGDCDYCSGGGHLLQESQHGVHVVEPIDVINRHREVAKAKYEEQIKKVTDKSQELETARNNLKYWDDQLMKLSGRLE